MMAELQSVRHLLTDASEAMAANASAMAQLENEHEACLEELRVARQSWQAAEMSLKVTSETTERLNAQVVQLTEELRIARDSQNDWRTKAEELRLKLERGGGLGGAGGSELQQEINRLEAKLVEMHRLRLLDAEKIAKQTAALERLEDLEKRLAETDKELRSGKKEADEWRSKAEAYAAELLAWRSKSEAWEASKAQSLRGLQQERDRLQAEWQMMRQSLQSAEASLAVQTAAVQRLEMQVGDLEQKLRDAARAAEEWEEREQQWKTEVRI
jgi:chromosome segregation ATPase